MSAGQTGRIRRFSVSLSITLFGLIIFHLLLFDSVSANAVVCHADELNGGNGDDKIYSADLNSPNSHDMKDIIICGEGYDEAWVSSTMDEDLISGDCEIIRRDVENGR